MDLVRSLVESITLTPEEGRLRIDLKGELAGILALCDAGRKKPGAGPLEQIKMVAGAGNQRYTNGLWLRPIHAVMAGLVPAIHAFEFIVVFKAWMPATSAGMTSQY